jgi:hypothetical protein
MRVLAVLAAALLLASCSSGEKLPLGLNLLMRSGDKPSADSDPFGQLFTWDGKPVYIQKLMVCFLCQGLAALM